ncbi:hypothetical protein XENTR_v10023413 [Xenopus tropicalis]|uniref:Xenoxin-1-like n=1 Tax=Xenopus tropicalis TaxID=8364 RepID=A0A8J1IV41_XENTR|nr:xenoxin-1-like [Xenopus tropicalis]KAE8578238.1 hypothetical protein XENTR_v10023413 [Xenopus tropicalis]
MRYAIIFLLLFVTLGNALRCMVQTDIKSKPEECGRDEVNCLTYKMKTKVKKFCASNFDCKRFSAMALPAEKVTCCNKDMCNQ